MKNITAVVLAAGLGTRMKTGVPKVLHPVGSRTILERIVLNLKRAGIGEIIAVVGHKAGQVELLFKGEVRFVRQKEFLGSGDAVRCAMDHLEGEDGSVLVTCGDTPLIKEETYRKLAETHLAENASCTVLTSRVSDADSYGRIARDAEGNILKIVEENDATGEEKEIKEINTGAYCFSQKDLRRFIREIKINGKKGEFYFTDIVGIIARNGKKIISESCSCEEAIGINSRKDLAEVNRIINRKSLEKLMESGVTIMDPGTTFIDEEAVIGRDTIIFPDTVIESGVTIAEGCRIGPFARLRSGTRIAAGAEIGNFVEICRTEVGGNTKIKHHTYLGDATVGGNVNIGAGAITANYDGREKHRTVIEDNASIGVGAILIAPVRIGKGAVVGAGSVVTKNKDVPAGETVAGIPAKPLVRAKKES